MGMSATLVSDLGERLRWATRMEEICMSDLVSDFAQRFCGATLVSDFGERLE